MFDYYVDEPSCSMVHWDSKVTPFIYQPDNFASNFVPTVETTRMSYLLELLVSRKNAVMLVGNTGEWLAFPEISAAATGITHVTS